MDNPAEARSFLTFEFLALCLILAAAFCNISVFYGFYHYLGVIEIPVVWRGFLVGLEPLSAFALRLFVLPWLHIRNAFGVLLVSLILLIFVSFSYLWVTTVPVMIALRIIHGAIFVLITSSAVALLVHFIPKERSTQGFSFISVVTLIPYAVIPLLTELLLPSVQSEAVIYASVSVFSAVAIALLLALRGRISRTLAGTEGVLLRRPTSSEWRDNFQRPDVFSLLSALFLIYLTQATVFYFMKNLSLETDSGDVGLFFTLSMTAMLAVRGFGAVLFDRLNKELLLTAAFALLLPCLILLPHVASPIPYALLTLVYGVSLGAILPLLSARLFLASPAPLRGLNTNMSLFAMDAAYCTIPHLGGILITLGADFSALFYVAAGWVALSLAVVTSLSRMQRKAPSAGGGTSR